MIAAHCARRVSLILSGDLMKGPKLLKVKLVKEMSRDRIHCPRPKLVPNKKRDHRVRLKREDV